MRVQYGLNVPQVPLPVRHGFHNNQIFRRR